jgi:predicted CXXCH cytochrome family protein
VDLSVVGLALLAALLWDHHDQVKVQARETQLQTLPRQGRPGGYVTSDTCQACHPAQHASWHRSYHRTMTQYATPETVRGPFTGQTLELAGERYRLERRGRDYWVEMPDPEWKWAQQRGRMNHANTNAAPPRVWKRIGLLTGSHHMQACWVSGTEGNLQFLFPFTYLIEDHRWVARNDVFLMDPALPHQVQTWNVTCLQCHTTGGQPRQSLDQADLLESRVGELGIACEACHGPGQQHVATNSDPSRRYALHLAGQADRTIVNPARLSHTAASQVCGQCHSIKTIPYANEWRQEGFRYRPGQNLEEQTPVIRPRVCTNEPWMQGLVKSLPTFVEDRYWSDGMVRVSGREFNGLIESPCYQRGQLSCLSCHSLHQSEPNDQLAVGMDSNQACLHCHQSIQVAQHTHHPSNSSGALCLNCHMPYTVYGLMKAIRSHQIDSPSAGASQKTGRPNACNLCHLDKSLSWTAEHLSGWFGAAPVELNEDDRTLSAATLGLLRGDAGQRALFAYSMGWEVARQASGQTWMVPYLAQLLDDPYASVRYIAHGSLRRIPGFENFSFDYTAPLPDCARARQKALQQWQATANKSPDRSGPHLLLSPSGAVQEEVWNRLIEQRDNHSIYLQE